MGLVGCAMAGAIALDRIRADEEFDFVNKFHDDYDELFPTSIGTSTCNYYDTCDFQEKTKDIPRANLSLFCINCQSLKAHYYSLLNLLTDIQVNKTGFDVIGLTEVFRIPDDICYSWIS